MSAGLDFASIRSSSAVQVISAVPPQSFNPTAMSRVDGRPAVRSLEQLRLHRALGELGWTGVIDEFNDAVRLTNPFVTEPILITTNGTILAGFGGVKIVHVEAKIISYRCTRQVDAGATAPRLPIEFNVRDDASALGHVPLRSATLRLALFCHVFERHTSENVRRNSLSHSESDLPCRS